VRQMVIERALPGIDNMADDLVERARAGDLTAFDTLVQRHHRLLLALAWRLTGRLADAQDVTQETFSRLHANLNNIRSEEAVRPWLRTVAVNLCRDLARKNRRSPLVTNDSVLLLPTERKNPEEQMASRQREQILHDALKRLTERERVALVLRELEGLTTAEVANTMGVTEATVRGQILQARLKLRTLLSGQLRGIQR